MYTVENLEADIIDYDGPVEFQVLTEYINETSFHLHVKRLDTTNANDGWNFDLNVFVHDFKGNILKYCIGSSPHAALKTTQIECSLFANNDTNNISLIASKKRFIWSMCYNPLQQYHIYHINRNEFNDKFVSNIVHLPSNMFAVGMKNGEVFMYHDAYGKYPWTYETYLSIHHIISVAYVRPRNFYFLFYAHDGYIEGLYPSTSRHVIPKSPPSSDYYIGKGCVEALDINDNSYPLLYDKKYVLAQSVHPDMDYVIAMPDRYYLCLNRYNLYRSIHRGIPFNTKISQIVFAGNERGNKYNFTKRRDIDMDPRSYFKSDAVFKDNIHAPNKIDRNEMINYKYILDIDGNASTWDATAWKLNSGSVIFKSDSNWIQWFYDSGEYDPNLKYKAWTHFVPVADDFSDIQDKFRWCEENQEHCEFIIKNCKELFHYAYSYKNVERYTERVIDKLVENCNLN